MSNPITWRSVGGPNVGSAAQTMALAQDSFKNVFSGLGNVLKDENALVQENWNRGKEANTNAFLAKLAEFQTPEEAQAAMAGLRGELGGYGAQIDGVAARTALGSLTEQLQRKALAAQQFEQGVVAHKDWKTDQADRPFLENLQQTNLTADTAQGRANLLAALQAGQAAGVLSSQGAAKATPVITGQTDLLVKKGREEAEFGWKGAEANIRAAKAAIDAEMAPLERRHVEEQINAIVAQRKAAQASAERAAREDSDRIAAARRLQETAARDAVLKTGPLGDGVIGDLTSSAGLRKALKENLGLPDNAIADVVENVYKTFKGGKFSVTVDKPDGTKGVEYFDVPVRAVVDAVAQNPDWVGNGSWWSRRGDTATSTLQDTLRNPDFIKEFRQALYLRDSGDFTALARAEQEGRLPGSGKGTPPKR